MHNGFDYYLMDFTENMMLRAIHRSNFGGGYKGSDPSLIFPKIPLNL